MSTKSLSRAQSLGSNIREAREGAGITQLTLAHKMGYTGEDAGAYISRVEAGKINPRIDTLQRLAKALKKTLEELLK